MPWSETSTMEQKRLFIRDYIRGSFGMAELCHRYGISRPTGYKWVKRFEVEGFPGLAEGQDGPKGVRTRPPSRSRRRSSNFVAGTLTGVRRSC